MEEQQNTVEKESMVELIEKNISKLESKDFNLYFFVLDTKNNPSGSLEYIYQTAFELKEMGYNVTMLYQGDEFVGVGEWLGEKYAELLHKEIEKDNINITPSDFLFIPDLFAHIMVQTKKLPCKRVIIVENYDYLAEFLPVGVTPMDLGIIDAICTTKEQEKKLNIYFPNLRTHVVRPAIKPIFRKTDFPKKLIVNIVARNQEDVKKIVKPFYWLFPMYKWVSFRDLRGVSQETFANALKEAAFTVWVDERTNFGYSCLEALRCGAIVFAKVPSHPADWMVDSKENEPMLTENVLWFDDIDNVPTMLSSAIRAWTIDKIPHEVYEKQDLLSVVNTPEQSKEDIKTVYEEKLFTKRLSDFKEVYEQIKNNGIKTNE